MTTTSTSSGLYPTCPIRSIKCPSDARPRSGSRSRERTVARVERDQRLPASTRLGINGCSYRLASIRLARASSRTSSALASPPCDGLRPARSCCPEWSRRRNLQTGRRRPTAETDHAPGRSFFASSAWLSGYSHRTARYCFQLALHLAAGDERKAGCQIDLGTPRFDRQAPDQPGIVG